MEETWQVKCSSGWPAQSALPPAAGSCNHINMDAQQFYRPTGMQVPNRGGSQMLQEPLLPCSFNTDFGKSGNSETGNSFLALLSGNWNHLSGELLHSPNSRSQLPKFLVPNGDALGQSTSHSFSANCISPLSKFHSNDAFFSGDLPSFIASPPLFSTSSKAPNIQPLRSHSHILGSPKAVTRCFSEDIIRGIGVSSKRCGPPSPSSSAIQNQNNQTSHNSSSDATVHGLIAPPSFFIGRPRVFCMNTTGELFLNDMGLLGVLCSCHCLPMSVAKFCQHSGLSATNPSDAIRMDSGMTLAQWCKICFGNLASGDLRGSEQLKYSSVERSTIGSKAPCFHSFSKNHGIINSVEEFGGPGRSGELRKNLYPHHPDLVGYTSMEKPVKIDMTYDHEKRNSVVNGRVGIAGLTRVSMPVVSENNNLHAVKGKSELMDTKMPHSSISNRREQNVVSHLISNDIKCRVTSANSSVSYSPWPKNFFSHDKNDSPRSNSSNEAFVVGRDGSDLRLGQPSQHKHSSISSFSAAMMVQHQNQLSDKSNLPADCAREVKRSRLNQSYPLIEASSSDKRLTDAEGLTTTSLHNSESENLLTYANKDSSISLFLSHLTGGTDLCGAYNKTHDETNNLTNSIHYDLPSSKENISLSSGNEIGEAWKASSFNEVVYCNDKGNPSVVIADNCSNVAGNNDVNSMQIEDKRVSPPFISGQCLRPCPVGVEKSSLFSSQPFRSLQKGPDAKNLSILEEAYHNHFVHGSEIGGSHWIGLSGSPDSETPITRSSTNSNYISEASCLSCKQDKKFSDHLMDGNLRLLASARHESLMDKQEQLGGSFKMKQHGRLYCLSTTEPHRNSCSEDLVEHKDVTRCSIHQNASDLHSLSNCFCNNRFGASHCKCGSAASFKCCNFATSTQSTTPCSKCSSYHVCGTDRHICYRPRDILIDTSLDNVQHEMCIYKAGNLPFSGNCCCAIISKCQSCCCFGGAVIAADTTNNPNVNGMLKHLNPTFDEDVTFQKERTVGLDHCAYCKKMVVMQNNCQTCFWRDVSGKNTGYSAAAPDNHLKTSEAPRVDKPTEIGSKNSDAIFKASTSLVEQQMSNRSGSSAPAITEVSVELNKKEAQVVNAENTMIFNYSEFDEGSAIEKCSSSDEMIDAGKCKEVSDTCCKVLASNSRHDFTSSHSSPNIMDELKFRDSPNQMSVRNKISTRCKDQEENCGRRRLTAVRELRNRKKSPKAPKGVFHFAHSEPLDSIDKAKYLQSSKRDGVSMHPETIVESTGVVSSGSLNIKRKSSDLTSSKFISLKKLENQNLQLENSKHLPEESEFLVAMEENVNFSLHGKRHLYQPMNHPNGERPPKYMSLSRIVDSRNHETEASTTSKRPVVCGNSGVISSGELNALQKPAKLVPLNLILKKAKRCRSNWEVEPKTSLFSKMVCADTEDLHCSDSSFCKSTVDSGNPYFGRSEVGSGRFFLSGTKSHVSNLGFGKGIKGAWYASIISRSNSMNKADTGKQWQINRRIEPFPVDAKALCSVCGSSNNEAINCLLECNRCMIRVHQACYGISKFPEDLWYCRPCKTDSNSQNIACVLCGYDGGAMTRALRSTNIVRSLLKVWKVTVGSTSRKIVCPFESMKDEVLNVSSLKADEAENDEYSFLPSVGSRSFEASPEAAAAIDERNLKNTIPEIDSFTDKVNTNNSIIKGAFDPSVMQWVHVVCGLWTPGTRCANVGTMDAFDVCGVLPTSKNIICSLCFRPGGSSIKCRDSNCSIHFHPWCAHQNGLLQSEIEGEANEKVGFYGKCTLHARNNFHHSDKQLMNVETPNPRIKEWSCARTEGFRGRGIGFILNYQKSFNDGDGCIVSQVQINAWLHINGQKSCMIGVKPTCSDVEYDLRKEYIRYKLSKGWKRLVVYKSGIHALGLYTSQFIARGAMVVEYVGEIVGLRVADKREIEYQSGRRLQCKSACYFFRIDKEHIIDATRKGGIARFVNHSCLPNCVAKIICIKNEKKVVFFAERDINPGEEITYDYHFNREDEGKKIPCFCNSKNCRRYLN